MLTNLHKIYPTIVTIDDFPCGSGKTTKMMQKLKPNELYLIVVPLRSEIERVLNNILDLSRFSAAPRARLSHLSFEGDQAFTTKC